MNQLINLTQFAINSELEQTVNARELHAFLEVGKVFAAWIQERIEQFGFVENQDFIVISETGKNPKGGRPAIEYYITLDMAKEFANWIKSRIADFGFIENQDFIKLHKKMELSKTGQTYKIIRKY